MAASSHRVIDHAHVPGVGLLLIIVDAFSGWPEALPVPDKCAKTTIRVLRNIFARLGVPGTLVSDNAPEFCDGQMQAWLQRIGCSGMRTPPYDPQSNGCVERMVQTVKRGLLAFSAHRGQFEAYLAKLLLNYRATNRSDGRGSPSALMGRQLRSPLTLSFQIDIPLVYKARPGACGERGRFVVQAGHNTAVITKGDDRPVLVHRDQIRPLHAENDPTVNRTWTPERMPMSSSDGEMESTSGPVGLDEEPVPIAPAEQPSCEPPTLRRSQRSTKGVPPDRLILR